MQRVAAVVCLASALPAFGQICGQWEAVPGIHLQPGVLGQVSAMAWFQGRLFVGGDSGFSVVRPEGPPILRLAAWASGGWEDPGSGNILPTAMRVLDLGDGPDLYIAGWILGGYRIFKLDGGQFTALPGTFNNTVRALTRVMENEQPVLYAGGEFTTIDGVQSRFAGRWDGQSWSPAAGLTGGSLGVYALAYFDDGVTSALYAGGDFTGTGAGSANAIARWRDEAWEPVPGGALAPFNIRVEALCPRPEGLYVGGQFTSAGGTVVNNIARRTASGWSAVGGGLTSRVSALESRGADLYAGTEAGLLRWDGAAWSTSGATDGGRVRMIAVSEAPENAIYIGGEFSTVNQVWSRRVARLDAQGWQAAPGGIPPEIYRMRAVRVGNQSSLFVAGNFTRMGGIDANNIARWDGAAWHALDSGTDGPVHALGEVDLGDGPALYAGGVFQNAGGTAASNIARWNGQGWSALGSGINLAGSPVLPGRVVSIESFSDASGPALYASGDFGSAGGQPATAGIARWNGITWSSLGGQAPNSGVKVISGFSGPNPGLYAFGYFNQIGGVSVPFSARWSGSAWSPFAAFTSQFHSPFLALEAALAGGQRLIVAGSFTSIAGQAIQHVAQWDGVAWSAVPLVSTDVIGALSAGDVPEPAVYILHGLPSWRLTRWDGNSAVEIPGLNSSYSNTVARSAYFDDGTAAAVYVGGPYIFGGGSVESRGLVRFRFCPPCYANCDGSTTPPILNVADFGCFLQRFAAGDPLANCDGSTIPPVLNVADFGCFISKFAAGCP